MCPPFGSFNYAVAVIKASQLRVSYKYVNKDDIYLSLSPVFLFWAYLLTKSPFRCFLLFLPQMYLLLLKLSLIL